MAEKILTFRVDVIGVSKEAQEITKLDLQLKNLNKTQKEIIKAREKGNISRKNSEKLLTQLSSRTQDLKTKKAQLLKVEKASAQQFQASAGSVQRLDLQMKNLRIRMNQVNLTTKAGQKEWRTLNAQYERGTATLRKYNARLSGSQRLQGAFTKGITNSIKTMAAGYLGITALIKVFRDLIKVTGDFDSSSAKLAAVTGKTREEISDLTEEAKLLGATTVFTASNVTDLQISLAKLGFTVGEIQNATAAVLDFAAATDADLGEAAKVAGVAVRAFGLDALETGDAVSTLAVATTKSALAFEDYETILATVGPVAKSYGFTLENTVALTGKLRDAGFDASKSATATRNILLNLADANGDLAKSLGGSVGTFDELIDGLITLDEKGVDLATTLELTDKRSVAAFNQFLAGAESVRKLNGEITDVNDELQTMVDTRLDSFAGDVKALSSAWEGFILRLKASGALREVVQFLKDAVLQVSNLTLAFRKFNKQSDEQISRSFDLLNSLSNKQGTQFKETIADLEDISIGEILLDPEKFQAKFAEIKNVNKKEAVALFDEYIRRREISAEKEIQIEEAKEKRITEDALDQQKKRNAAIAKENENAAEDELKAAKAKMNKLLADTTAPSDDGGKQLAEDYKIAIGQIEMEFANWGEIQERQYQEVLDAQLRAWDAETQAFRDKEAEQLAIAKAKEQAIADIKEASINLVFTGLDSIAAFQRANYDKEIALAGDNEKKKEEISKKYAKKEQRLSIVASLINTAVAVTKSLTAAPPPFNFILAAITGAAGALQTAGIAAQKFAGGGKVQPGSEMPGAPKGGDNTLAVVKPGEVILNSAQQSRAGGVDFFKSIGVPGFASGGVMPGPVPNTSNIDQQISMSNQLSQLRVVLNVNELHDAEGELEVINESSGL